MRGWVRETLRRYNPGPPCLCARRRQRGFWGKLMNLGTPATKGIAVAFASFALISIATVAGQSTAPAARAGAQAPSAPAPAVPPARRPAASAASTAATTARQQALLDQYCVSCHNDRVKTANLSLQGLDLAAVGDHAELWEKVVRKLRAGVMPPPDVKRPSLVEY